MDILRLKDDRIKLLNKRVLVTRVKKAETKVGELFLPDATQISGAFEAVVRAVGDKVHGITKGEKVLVNSRFACEQEVVIGDEVEASYVIRDNDVLASID